MSSRTPTVSSDATATVNEHLWCFHEIQRVSSLCLSQIDHRLLDMLTSYATLHVESSLCLKSMMIIPTNPKYPPCHRQYESNMKGLDVGPFYRPVKACFRPGLVSNESLVGFTDPVAVERLV